MYDTRKLLAPFVDKDLMNLSLEELSDLYKMSPETSILATAYYKLYTLAYKAQSTFLGLDKDDVASVCLELLDTCLRTYDNESSAFSTYFIVVFKRKLKAMIDAAGCKKRKCVLESLEELIDVGIEDTFDAIEFFIPNNLTTKELIFCELALQGYDRIYIANVLGVTKQFVYQMAKKLQVKFKNLYNY